MLMISVLKVVSIEQSLIRKNGYIIADDILTGTGKTIIPIYLFGFLS